METSETPKNLGQEEQKIRKELAEKGIDPKKQKTVLAVGFVDKDGSISLKQPKK